MKETTAMAQCDREERKTVKPRRAWLGVWCLGLLGIAVVISWAAKTTNFWASKAVAQTVSTAEVVDPSQAVSSTELAVPDEAVEVADPIEQAHSLREALGYDALRLAVLGLSAEQYDAILSITAEHTAKAQVQLAPAIAAYVRTHQQQVAASETPEFFGQAVDNTRLGSQRLQQLTGELAQALRSQLSAAQQAGYDRLVANPDLEPPLALVGDLSEEQLAILTTAQRERDRLLAMPENWHRQGIRTQAQVSFEMIVTQTLNPRQLEEARQLTAQQEAGLQVLMEREILAYETANAGASSGSSRVAGGSRGTVLSWDMIRVLSVSLKNMLDQRMAAFRRAARVDAVQHEASPISGLFEPARDLSPADLDRESLEQAGG